MKRKDNGWKNHYKALKQLSSMKVQIGAIGDHAPDTPGGKSVPNAVILRLAETGYPSNGIEPRFAITRGLHENVPYLSKLTNNLLRVNHSKKGFDIKKIGDGIGNAMVQIIRGTIMSGLTPALKPDYLKKKTEQGFSDLPYVKTHQLINSIDYGVKE